MRELIALLLVILCLNQIADARTPVNISELSATAEKNAKANQETPQPLTAYDILTNAAKACPGVGDVVVGTDSSRTEVVIVPGPYATSIDLSNAVATILATYAALLDIDHSYQGYLRIGIMSRVPDTRYDQNYNVVIFEATAYETRMYTTHFKDQKGENQTGVPLEYANYIIGQAKTFTYTVPGPVLPEERYSKFGGERDWLQISEPWPGIRPLGLS
jgi:hypothetical protein